MKLRNQMNPFAGCTENSYNFDLTPFNFQSKQILKCKSLRMPKAVDVYVLQKKIGSGQFGDVFKGYSKVDGTDVAIKTINRSKIKGKFTELLENEIKVLRSCKNNNIIRLIDIKKTKNNIYLILEFCNEGDLGAYLKTKKKLPEDEAVEYFVQILHAFQTLVKNKIMHRDFKLPNVLKHDGVIKLADFGFAKLLGDQDQQVETILGSPLNMAPEVLDRQTYNTKADIWSIGVGFYEMIFGRVPYTATNIIDLLKKIRKEPLFFPQKVSPVIEDVIRKMLVVDPKKRIQWADLFNHPITSFLEEKIEQSLRESLLCDKESFKFNLSKFYIKTNMVIESPYQINAKQDLNKHIKEMMKNESPSKFSGDIIKRNKERKKQDCEEVQMETQKTEKQIKQEEGEEFEQMEVVTEKEKFKRNWKTILYYRNMYAFFGHLAEEILENNYNVYGECLAFLLLKKAISRITTLKKQLKQRKLIGVELWAGFQSTEEYLKVLGLITQQQQIFSQLYEKLALKVLEKGTLSQFEEDLMVSGKYTVEQTQKRIYIRVMREYFNRILKQFPKSTSILTHMSKLIDSLNAEQLFIISFDFNSYYDSFKEIGNENVDEVCWKKYEKFSNEYLTYQ